MNFQPFSDEQARVIVNLEQAYQVWMEALRALNGMPYNMRIKEVSGREYLYEVTDRRGSMKSKGPLDQEKQAEFDEYKAEKAELKERLAGSKDALKEQASLYRALRLLRDVGSGAAIASLAREGGLQSTMWAGPEQFSREMLAGTQPVQGTLRSGPVALRLGFAGPDDGYAIDLGLPRPSGSRFDRDPEIKAEALWTGEVLDRMSVLVERRGPSARVRRIDDGSWRELTRELSPGDSVVTRCADPGDGLEMLRLRDRMRGWRFYDDLRTDRDAPARRTAVGTFTPILGSDGGDLAAAIQTIIEIGDADSLADTIADAFSGASIGVDEEFTLHMRQPGLLRPLHVRELSDGTLRYILLAAALLSPRPPELMVLNEPEASLHGDLIEPLEGLPRLVRHPLPDIGRLGIQVSCSILVPGLSHLASGSLQLLHQPDLASNLLAPRMVVPYGCCYLS